MNLERSARAAGKGLWAAPSPVPPWEWRKRGRGNGQTNCTPEALLILGVSLSLVLLVGVRGFEPPTPASRRQCSTRLSYTPTLDKLRLFQ